MARTPVYFLILNDKIEKHFKNNSLSESFVKGTERAKEIIVELKEARFNLDTHLSHNNRNSAQYNKGCGCEYCRVRSRIVEEKIRLSRLERAFESELYFYSRRKEETEQEAINAFTTEKAERKQIIESYKIRKAKFEKALKEMGVDIRLLEKTV
jgi:hypothetical protein